MHVTKVFDDEDPSVPAEYSIEGYPVKVVTEPSLTGDGTAFVEVWDSAGCQIRESRPADQVEQIAIKTLLGEYRADLAEGVIG